MSCAKTAELIKMPLGMWTQVGSRKHVLDGGAHWRNLANTIEPSREAAMQPFLSNYFDHLYVFVLDQKYFQHEIICT